MRLFNKVAIVGTGLIGGSIALAIKKNRLAREVVGVSRRKKNLLLAKRKGAIDRGSLSLKIIKGADLLILAMPVNAIINLAPQIARFTNRDCIVTDVGSTKEKIVERLEALFPNYVGSHPLAGSERGSVQYAFPDIFKNTLCVLTRTRNTSKKAFYAIGYLWLKIGAFVTTLNPQKHDKILSFVSHLPHVAAFALINSIPKKYLGFASSGFQDTTRIGVSDSELWADIFLSNRKSVLNSIKILESNIAKINSAIMKKDRKRLVLFLMKAKRKRESLP